jgi:hypothetical protein
MRTTALDATPIDDPSAELAPTAHVAPSSSEYAIRTCVEELEAATT